MKGLGYVAVAVIAALLLFSFMPKTAANEDDFIVGSGSNTVSGAVGIKMYLIDIHGQRTEIKLDEKQMSVLVDAGRLMEIRSLQIVPYARIEKAPSEVAVTILAGSIKVDDGEGHITVLRRIQTKNVIVKPREQKELITIDISALELANALIPVKYTGYNLGSMIIDMQIKVTYQGTDGRIYEKTFNFHSQVDVVYKDDKFIPYSVVTVLE